MAQIEKRGFWYWHEFDPAERKDAGADLAKLRRGLGREAGSVPDLWRFYRVIVPEQVATAGSWRTPALDAEHAALTLFALHQQGRDVSMHKDGEHLGSALLKLRRSDQFKSNPEALDARVGAAATATSVAELVFHLRSLITCCAASNLRSTTPGSSTTSRLALARATGANPPSLGRELLRLERQTTENSAASSTTAR